MQKKANAEDWFSCLLQKGGSFGQFLDMLKVSQLQSEPEYCFNGRNPMFKLSYIDETEGILLTFPEYEQFKGHLSDAMKGLRIDVPKKGLVELTSKPSLVKSHSIEFEKRLGNQPDGSIKLMTADTDALAGFLLDIYRSDEYEPLSDDSILSTLFNHNQSFKCS